jgi:hypothetical protein
MAARKAPPKKAVKKSRAAHLKPHRWKPGQSGNLKGRPKMPTLEEVMRKHLEEVPKGEKETRLQLMVKVVFEEAVDNRNTKVLIALLDRLWPKPLAIKVESEAPVAVARSEPDLSVLSIDELRTVRDIYKKVTHYKDGRPIRGPAESRRSSGQRP